jgi:hypothetical protein
LWQQKGRALRGLFVRLARTADGALLRGSALPATVQQPYTASHLSPKSHWTGMAFIRDRE